MAIKHGSETESSVRKRITARLSAKNREIPQFAAELSVNSLNQFIVQSALRAAEQVIEQEEAIQPIRLTMEESKRFFALLDEPPKPNEALQRAMARFRSNKIDATNPTA